MHVCMETTAVLEIDIFGQLMAEILLERRVFEVFRKRRKASSLSIDQNSIPRISHNYARKISKLSLRSAPSMSQNRHGKYDTLSLVHVVPIGDMTLSSCTIRCSLGVKLPAPSCSHYAVTF
jgi:hypothetical protein